MRWTPGDRSDVEDMRGNSGFGLRAGGLGLGGIIIALLLSWFTGIDFLSLVSSGPGTPPATSTGASRRVQSTPEEERLVDFVDAVMRDVQQTWRDVLPQQYEPTHAVLFRDAIDSACGFAQSATGPFYCPGDRKVYLDLGFYDELRTRFGAPGDFAQAYVLAHEIGHHVQNLLGIEQKVRGAQRSDPSRVNALSVLLELQADCFAGVWGHSAARPGRAAQGRIELEAGDVEEGLHAAAAIGDDRLQKMATGRVMPDRFTHGSSEQRVAWFRRGLDSGDPQACNTFER